MTDPTPSPRALARPGRLAGGCSVACGWLGYFWYVRTALYLVGFLANWRVSKTIDAGPFEPWAPALLIDAGLLALFALPHSLMARPAFKASLARFVPPALERSLYVWVAATSLALLLWQWRPLPALVWRVEAPWFRISLWGLFGAGWLLTVASTKSHGHFRLFGVAAAWAFARGRELPEPKLLATGLYGWLRHPMYLGFLLGSWATPDMSAGHLLFAGAMTAYILIGLRLEERDLEARYGEAYRAYREAVGRWMV